MSDFLDSLTEEQKEELLILLTKDKKDNNEKPKKQRRTQNRRNKGARKPKRTAKQSKKHSRIPSGRNIGRREEFDTKKRKNIFVSSSDFNKHKQDSAIDKKLLGDHQITERDRSTSYLTATCSKCKYVFEDVPERECYKDDEGIMFVCEDCSVRR